MLILKYQVGNDNYLLNEFVSKRFVYNRMGHMSVRYAKLVRACALEALMKFARRQPAVAASCTIVIRITAL